MKKTNITKTNIAGVILGFSVLSIAVLSACSDPLRAAVGPPLEPPITDGDASSEGGALAPELCIATDCPAPYATCLDKSGTCTTNLSNDIFHCGSCEMRCPRDFYGKSAFFVCKTGRCEMLCEPGSGDCNGLVDDGCEVDLAADPANCGACGNACAPGDACRNGSCGCPSGQVVCDGRCVRLSDDPYNCGVCGRECGPDALDVPSPCGPGVFPARTTVTCINSKCQVGCQYGSSDCNGNFCGDGCETLVANNPEHCGTCNHKCSAEQSCVSRKCICEPGLTRCRGDECVDLQSDVQHCGACGNVCPGQETLSGSPVCEMGRCTFACTEGYANCDGRLENGCEVNLTVDPLNCGACGAQCDIRGGQPCAGSKCLTRPCDAGVIQ